MLILISKIRWSSYWIYFRFLFWVTL